MIGRLINFLLGQDESLNALGGGKPRETISGTVGRGVIDGKWWAPWLAYAIDGLFGDGHCARAAASEALRRAAEMGQ